MYTTRKFRKRKSGVTMVFRFKTSGIKRGAGKMIPKKKIKILSG